MTEPADGGVQVRRNARPPGAWARRWAVVLRHWQVYQATLIANALPAFLEPLLFVVGVGIGLGGYLNDGMGGLPLGAYMTPGALAMTAMYTASFETTYGTFIRYEYQKIYAGMLASPLSVRDVFWGELIWCGLKGAGFAAIVFGVIYGVGNLQGWGLPLHPRYLLLPLGGFAAGFLFGGLGLHVAARVHTINNFTFYFTGVLTPLSLFSGMVFPVSDLPVGLCQLAYALPLFHVTETNRWLIHGAASCVPWVWVCPLYLLGVGALVSWTGVRAIERRIIV